MAKETVYYVRRTYGENRDWLVRWDDEFGTVCQGSRRNAMAFVFSETAELAADRANRVCMGRDGRPKPDDMFFEVVGVLE